ncbi:peptidoglycan recognition protein [Streptomyces sp. ME19-01-6]|uniref:peptidoglycan recognition protein family protein n=1 Tax=Streptomyces sp. ME19-01-6 TaxID=3028686 RepID=UPI0029BD2CA7|nr:N-acetylmuramoyl-L-alanine amidase [Streptomyces sp. ME19-01-6]MDX3230837.1 N-acetylmuramoyl-L-alanine amidase [Streptomyces sp. ME19-01-6]
MRAFLASSIGVACTAALALPLALNPAPARGDRDGRAESAGGTQSLPLLPLGGSGLDRGAAMSAGAVLGVAPRSVRPFSLVGVVWDDASARLRGQVQVRTREAATGAWSAWRDLEALDDDAPDPDSPESAGGRRHGGTTPLWVGDSNGVQARVSPRGGSGVLSAQPAGLPSGLRLELVDPGRGPATLARPLTTDPSADPSTEPGSDPSTDPSSEPAMEDPPADLSASPEAPQADPEDPSAPPEPEPSELTPEPSTPPPLELPEEQPKTSAAQAHTAPRPRIVTRAGWGADEKLREKGHRYTKTVKVAFVHHTVTGNAYSCSQVPSVMRSIYRYHVKSMGWRDFGYNFAVDKCGNIYEGRSGGVTKAVQGAHTLGFNKNSMGIAVLGTYSSKKPAGKAVKAVAKLTAWKLGLFGRNPRGTTHLTSAGGNRYKKGKKAKLRVISGHRDGYNTECPGDALYTKLGTVRSKAARLQGR